MPLDEFIIDVYCEICEAYAAVTDTPLRRCGFARALSDQEALTLEIVGANLGMSQDKRIWCYFHRHWRAWFPRLGARSTFVRQSINLWAIKQCMHRHWVGRLRACRRSVHIADSFPMPVCHFLREHFSQVYWSEATFGYCASKTQTYCGFKAMRLTSDEGIVDMDFSGIPCMQLGDKGLLLPTLTQKSVIWTT